MKLYSHPVLKFRTKDRLHISKEPGLISWILLLLITSLGIFLDFYIIPDYFTLHVAFLSMCLIFSLNIMKTWDLIMDREENLGTMINRSWYHVFSIRVPEENVQRFILSTISSVIVTSNFTIDIKRQDGSPIQIISESSNYKLLKKLRKEISVFLCLERLEKLNTSDKTFHDWELETWNGSSGTSENQDSDSEIAEGSSGNQQESVQYGSNIKILTGVL